MTRVKSIDFYNTTKVNASILRAWPTFSTVQRVQQNNCQFGQLPAKQQDQAVTVKL
jgi:hypothetical protein